MLASLSILEAPGKVKNLLVLNPPYDRIAYTTPEASQSGFYTALEAAGKPGADHCRSPCFNFETLTWDVPAGLGTETPGRHPDADILRRANALGTRDADALGARDADGFGSQGSVGALEFSGSQAWACGRGLGISVEGSWLAEPDLERICNA